MAVDQDLSGFVKEALLRGVPRPQIQEALLHAGWEREEVQKALAAFAEIDFPVPVPRPRAYLSAREAFLYLILFTTLYISAYQLGSLLFGLIDLALPDPASALGEAFTREQIRWAIASLVIAFPVFLYVSAFLARSIRRDPSKRASKIRKWLTYMTLFMAAAVIIGDLTSLVYSFLADEQSLRFMLKVLTIGIIAAVVFGYYLRDVRRGETGSDA